MHRSVAGDSTCVMVSEPFKAMFDIGLQARSIISHDVVFISHGHMDHVAALPWHAAQRAMGHMAPPTYFAPPATAAGLEAVLAASRQLQEPGEACLAACIVPLSASSTVLLSNSQRRGVPAAAAASQGDSRVETAAGAASQTHTDSRRCRAVELPPDTAPTAQWAQPRNFPFCVRPLPAQHRVEGCGFCVFSRSIRLAESVKLLSRQALLEAEAAGESLHTVHERALFAASGDTLLDAVLGSPEALQASVLVLECTYLEETPKTSVSKCRSRGHTHLVEVAAAWAAGTFQNEHILLAHVSRRYRFGAALKLVTGTLHDALVTHLKQELGHAPSAAEIADASAQRPHVHVHCPPDPLDVRGAAGHEANPRKRPAARQHGRQHSSRGRGRGRGRGGSAKRGRGHAQHGSR